MKTGVVECAGEHEASFVILPGVAGELIFEGIMVRKDLKKALSIQNGGLEN